MYRKEISKQLHGLRAIDKKTTGLFVSFKERYIEKNFMSVKAAGLFKTCMLN
jgi:hypothetical protein